MEKHGRFDFEIEKINSDTGDNEFQFRIKPDSRRYDEVELDGVRYYRDKFLRTLVTLETMAHQMRGLPLYHLSPSIKSTPEYADRRRESVIQQLQGGKFTEPDERAAQHHEFSSESEKNLAFLSVDICGATAYRRKDPRGFDKAYPVFIRELGTLVGHFNGSILKTTGDGFIAYIDHPSFTSQCDAAVDLGLSLISFTVRTLNPSLKSEGLKPFSIRVGGDYGPAVTHMHDIPSINYRNIEVSSDALNRAVKIEESCRPNQFRIGRNLYELIHVQWLERATEVIFSGSSVGIENYKVYKMQ
ncbi:adenylate/guanylate cyclase domain-containing protein [Burkholderia gladioli]|uniref:adenylate/guanylate cyclase domain-containing protein n=1 Tax=Burkholderia gladioli TaxID=28095 RepID=UPI0016404401|nr:adenylate/guanylate cyclase domain-containing protein [Burkholderia gladioli]